MTDALKMAREALARIERWDEELPATGKTWPGGMPMSYSAAYGSNGVRDYMRGIARAAIAAIDAQQAAPVGQGLNWEQMEERIHEEIMAPAEQAAPVALTPLTQDTVLDMAEGVSLQFHDLLAFARAIERAHGIGAAAQGGEHG